jgi:hypothetical protein
MGKGKGEHGNLSPAAAAVYEAIRRDNPSYSKSKAAKIANATISGTIDHHGGHGKGRASIKGGNQKGVKAARKT